MQGLGGLMSILCINKNVAGGPKSLDDFDGGRGAISVLCERNPRVVNSVYSNAPLLRISRVCLGGLLLVTVLALPTQAQRNYGPCECQPRGTLMQWSYGTSFSGGPDLDAPLVTDRPDFTEASSTVGLGVAQLEIGYTYGFDNDGTDQTITHSYAEPLLRVGILADWLEFRIFQSAVTQIENGVEESGATDLYLGFKIGLTPQEGLLPEMALIPQMTVPTGSDDFGSNDVLAGLNWIYGWEVSECIGTAGSTQFNRSEDDTTSRAFTRWAQSWTIAYSLTDRLGAYTEWFGLFPHSADTADTEHYFNGGFTVLLSNDVQWDIRGGVGLNDASEDYFVGTGLSLRFR